LINGPFFGSVPYVLNGSGDGIFVALLAAVAFVLALFNLFLWSSLTGCLILAVIVYTLHNVYNKLSEMQTQMHNNLNGTAFQGLGEAFSHTVNLGVGWPVLVIGAMMLIVAGWIQEPS